MGILMFLSPFLMLVIIGMFKGEERDNYWVAGDVGGSASKSDSSGSSSTKVKQTKEEKELNQLDLQLRKAAQGGLMDVQNLGLSLSKKLLGGEDLPGYYKGLPGGISEEVTQDLVNKSLEDIATTAQFSGILDSGTAGELAMTGASDIRTATEQWNLENLMKLLALSFGGAGQSSSGAMGVGQSLGQRLAGLRSTSSNFNQSTMTYGGDFKASIPGISKASGGSITPTPA